jgi:hypothetical protein
MTNGILYPVPKLHTHNNILFITDAKLMSLLMWCHNPSREILNPGAHAIFSGAGAKLARLFCFCVSRQPWRANDHWRDHAEVFKISLVWRCGT